MNQAPKIRLYVPEAFAAGGSLALSQAQSHYLAHVMRAREGDKVGIFNGSDGEWLAEVASVAKKAVTLQLRECLSRQKDSPDIWLAFAPIKAKVDIVVEKAVELGVSALMPVYTRYAVVKSVNREKLVAHAVEAAEQSGRHDVPRIEEFKDLAALLGSWPKGRTLLFADESGQGENLKVLLPSLPPGKYGILVGPEGGFAPDEQRMLRVSPHVKAFSMGPRILRADTASVAALACVQAWVGDWEEKPGFESAGMADILKILEALDTARGDDVEQWFAQKRREATPFFYSSVDLRHSGRKIAAVDTNLFPAGFNNLSPAAQARASRFIARFMEDRCPKAKRVVIVPENHTRNLPYLDNLATLISLFETLGIEVQLGSLIAHPGQPVELDAPSGRRLTQHPMKRDGNMLSLENGFTPDIVIVNNDMTAGSPEILQSLSQPVLPPVGMGWYRRRKSVHFAAYKKLVEEFGLQFGIDPWLLGAEFHQCGVVNFKERTGLDCVANGIEKVLSRVREKYREYHIGDTPYVFVKADSGTYGMGIMTVRSPEEILDLNKKERNKMQVIKEGTPVHEVIIQEGVPTIDRIKDKPAEPMVYMIDGVPVGGMYRVNAQRDAYGNLNAAGMEFTGMCDEVEEDICGDWEPVENCHFRSFGIIAAIAALAAAREDYDRGKQSPLQACC